MNEVLEIPQVAAMRCGNTVDRTQENVPGRLGAAEYVDTYLGRQPILDHRETAVGYEQLFRRGLTGEAEVTNATEASAQVLVSALGSHCHSLEFDGRSYRLKDAAETLARKTKAS